MYHRCCCVKASSLVCASIVGVLEVIVNYLKHTDIRSSEDISFSPREELLRGSDDQTVFERTALDFLDDGIDAIGQAQFQGLRDVANYFPVGDDVTSAFIMTPQNEAEAAVDGNGDDTSVFYTEGLLYQGKITQLMAKIESLIPGIPITVRQYQAMNALAPNADEIFNTRRGKALFQYDPRATTRQKGVRLYLEGDRAMNKFWAPEDRLLSGPESQSTTQSSCAGQSYDRNQVSWLMC